MTNHKHGGRRPNQTGRPPKTEARYTRKTITLPPGTYAGIKAAQEPSESFSECVARLCQQSLRH
jgi:hypothetical protein